MARGSTPPAPVSNDARGRTGVIAGFGLALLAVGGLGFALGQQGADNSPGQDAAPVITAAGATPVVASDDEQGADAAGVGDVEPAAFEPDESGDVVATPDDGLVVDDAAAAGDPETIDDADSAGEIDGTPSDEAIEDAVVEPDDAVEPDADADAHADAEPEDTAEAVDLADEVPESTAVIRNGQIFFEGAVPTQEQGDEIAGYAIAILGEENVFNNYVVDPRAGDPSDGNITVEDTINFATDSAEILPESEALLNQGFALFTLRPAMTATVVGHTDSRGSIDGNLALSLARAQAVADWFIERGVDPSRLTVEGVGSFEPVASNDTVDGRRQNRRIQFFLANVLGD